MEPERGSKQSASAILSRSPAPTSRSFDAAASAIMVPPMSLGVPDGENSCSTSPCGRDRIAASTIRGTDRTSCVAHVHYGGTPVRSFNGGYGKARVLRNLRKQILEL